MTITPEDLEAIRAVVREETTRALDEWHFGPPKDDILDDLAAPTDPARIAYTPEMETELAAQWSEPLREWAEAFLRETRGYTIGSATVDTFKALVRDGLIDPTVEGVIAFQWWMTKKSTAPGWDEPAPSPAATFRQYAREVGGQKGL